MRAYLLSYVVLALLAVSLGAKLKRSLTEIEKEKLHAMSEDSNMHGHSSSGDSNMHGHGSSGDSNMHGRGSSEDSNMHGHGSSEDSNMHGHGSSGDSNMHGHGSKSAMAAKKGGQGGRSLKPGSKPKPGSGGDGSESDADNESKNGGGSSKNSEGGGGSNSSGGGSSSKTSQDISAKTKKYTQWSNKEFGKVGEQVQKHWDQKGEVGRGIEVAGAKAKVIGEKAAKKVETENIKEVDAALGYADKAQDQSETYFYADGSSSSSQGADQKRVEADEPGQEGSEGGGKSGKGSKGGDKSGKGNEGDDKAGKGSTGEEGADGFAENTTKPPKRTQAGRGFGKVKPKPAKNVPEEELQAGRSLT